MLTLLTTIAFITSGLVAKAQNAVNGKVDGVVMSSQKSIESATIGILRAKDSSVVKMGVSNKTGQFEVENIKEGKIPMSRIDDAVRRILRVKMKLGLFEKPLPDYNYYTKRVLLSNIYVYICCIYVAYVLYIMYECVHN